MFADPTIPLILTRTPHVPGLHWQEHGPAQVPNTPHSALWHAFPTGRETVSLCGLKAVKDTTFDFLVPLGRSCPSCHQHAAVRYAQAQGKQP